MILAGLIVAGIGSAEERLYTNYFCPPCRAMEPAVEPLLKDLLKKNAIRMTLVDTPYNPATPLYARNFLYALNENNDIDHAFQVRNILLEASTNKDFMTQERLEALFKEKGIPYAVFDKSST